MSGPSRRTISRHRHSGTIDWHAISPNGVTTYYSFDLCDEPGCLRIPRCESERSETIWSHASTAESTQQVASRLDYSAVRAGRLTRKDGSPRKRRAAQETSRGDSGDAPLGRSRKQARPREVRHPLKDLSDTARSRLMMST